MRTNTGQNNDGDEGPKIRNRADLIEALTIAAQLEHGLMLMYLYAAFSMKAFPEELQGYKEPPQILRAWLRDWESSILRVARQEMEHLSFVCNMLSGIGGAQYFERASFPQDHRYWPVELPIELERFGVRSLLRFLAYEKPQNLCGPEVERLIRPHRKDPGDQQAQEFPDWPCRLWFGSWDADSLTMWMGATVVVQDLGHGFLQWLAARRGGKDNACPGAE